MNRALVLGETIHHISKYETPKVKYQYKVSLKKVLEKCKKAGTSDLQAAQPYVQDGRHAYS